MCAHYRTWYFVAACTGDVNKNRDSRKSRPGPAIKINLQKIQWGLLERRVAGQNKNEGWISLTRNRA